MKSADTLALPLDVSALSLARLTLPPLRMHVGDFSAAARRLLQPRDERTRVHERIGQRDTGVSYTLVEADSENRAAIEDFIRRNYEKNFGARVEAFMPRLFGLYAADGNLCGAFGVRTTVGKLFLEQYLQGAIETEISARSGRTIARPGIVEIGHFSGAIPGAARMMIYLLTQQLRAENFTWVTFTGTHALRNAFQRMGLTLLDIAPADCMHLPAAARAGWGSYYEHAPRVMAGEISSGYSTLMLSATAAAEERGA